MAVMEIVMGVVKRVLSNPVQITAGEIKVSELQPADRDEALFVTMESRDGAHFVWLTPILRDGNAVTLGETLAFPDAPGGRFAGLFEP